MTDDRKVVDLASRRALKAIAELPRERVRYELVPAALDVGLINEEYVAIMLDEDNGIGMPPEAAEKLAARLLEVAKIVRAKRGW